MWRSWCCGGLGLIFEALVLAAPVPGWAETPRKKVPNEVRLREAEELERDYVRLRKDGKYREAGALAKQACSILEAELGTFSAEFASCINDLAVLYKRQKAYDKAEPLYRRAL